MVRERAETTHDATVVGTGAANGAALALRLDCATSTGNCGALDTDEALDVVQHAQVGQSLLLRVVRNHRVAALGRTRRARFIVGTLEWWQRGSDQGGAEESERGETEDELHFGKRAWRIDGEIGVEERCVR